MKTFDSLSEQEILALAISLEEEDERVYADFAEGLRDSFPASAAVFDAMRADETGHRHKLLSLYRKQFGNHIPLIRRQDVKGFVQRTPVWLVRPLGLDTVRNGLSLAITAGWGHGQKEKDIVMPGRGIEKQREFTADEKNAIAQGANELGIAPEEVTAL